MERAGLRAFESSEENKVRNITVKAGQLEKGDYSASHNRRIARIYTQQAGQQVVVVFEPTLAELAERREGTTVFLDSDDSLEITRGRESDPYN